MIHSDDIYYVAHVDVTPDEPRAGWYYASEETIQREVICGPFFTPEDASRSREKRPEAPAAPSAEGLDTQRLNWLEQQGYAYGFQDMHEGNRWTIEGPYRTVRAAIDDAIASEPQPIAGSKGVKVLDADELELFKMTVDQFEDSNETSTDYATLMRWVRMGLLECSHFDVTRKGQDLVDGKDGAA